MSEYWKSTPKYWCKHCSLYVRDTSFERKQHENTGKHQGNLKRFLRGIQNEHERSERVKERAKAEVERLNKVVGGASSAQASTPGSNHTNRRAAAAAPTATDQKRQWAQLAEMGIKVPDAFRGEMAMAGQWQTTSSPAEDLLAPEDSLSVGVRKRKLEDQEEEAEEAGETLVRRGWGMTTKRYPGQAANNVDLDALLKEPLIKKDLAGKTEISASLTGPRASTDESKLPADNIEEKSSLTKEKMNDGSNENAIEQELDERNIKQEDTMKDRLSLLEDDPSSMAAPVFKKRKAKSKVACD